VRKRREGRRGEEERRESRGNTQEFVKEGEKSSL
jgi:hypothetical protein